MLKNNSVNSYKQMNVSVHQGDYKRLLCFYMKFN